MSQTVKKVFFIALLGMAAILYGWALAVYGQTAGVEVTNPRYKANVTGTPTWVYRPLAVNGALTVSGGSVTAHLDNAGVSVLSVVATNGNSQGILGTSSVTIYQCPGSTQAIVPSQVYTNTGAGPATLTRYFNGILDGTPIILQSKGSAIIDTEYNMTAGDVIEASGNTLVTSLVTFRENPL